MFEINILLKFEPFLTPLRFKILQCSAVQKCCSNIRRICPPQTKCNLTSLSRKPLELDMRTWEYTEHRL